MRFSPEAVARFWGFVEKSDGCWEWRGAVKDAAHPYGRMSVGGARVKAHRFSYELVNGPIEGGLHVLHKCDNPRCVRPEHLFLGTPKDNALDRAKKGRGKPISGDAWHRSHDGRHGGHVYPIEAIRRGEECAWSKLTEAQVVEIRACWAVATKKYGLRKKLADQYNVDKTLIWLVVTRRIWRHVP